MIRAARMTGKTALKALLCAALLPLGAADPARSQQSATCPVQKPGGMVLQQSLEDFFDTQRLSLNTIMLTFPLDWIDEFVKGGCEDAAFLGEIISRTASAYEPATMPERYLYSRKQPYHVNADLLRVAIEVHLAGEPGLLEGIVARLRKDRDEGDVQAATALSILGIRDGSIIGTLDQTAQVVLALTLQGREGASRYFDMPALGRATGPLNAEITDKGLRDMIFSLEVEMRSNLKIAVEGRSPVAHRIRLRGRPHLLQPCQHEEVAFKFRRLPDPHAVLADMRRLSEEIAAAPRQHPHARSFAERMALDAANIASDCAYSGYPPPEGGFGINDPALGAELVALAARIQQDFEYTMDSHLPIALHIEQTSGPGAGHEAAARFMLAGLLLEEGNPFGTYEHWLARFSPATIAEAQRIMARHGLYSAGIDGVAGPGFRAGVKQLHSAFMYHRLSDYPEVDLGDADEIRASEWAGRFLSGGE